MKKKTLINVKRIIVLGFLFTLLSCTAVKADETSEADLSQESSEAIDETSSTEETPTQSSAIEDTSEGTSASETASEIESPTETDVTVSEPSTEETGTDETGEVLPTETAQESTEPQPEESSQPDESQPDILPPETEPVPDIPSETLPSETVPVTESQPVDVIIVPEPLPSQIASQPDDNIYFPPASSEEIIASESETASSESETETETDKNRETDGDATKASSEAESTQETWPMGFSGAGDGSTQEAASQIEATLADKKEGAGLPAKIIAVVFMIVLLFGTLAYGYFSLEARMEMKRRERQSRSWKDPGE